MFTKEQHSAKALANEKFADALDRADPCQREWAIIALFYTAVHLVQSYFSQIGRQPVTHTTRDSAIKRDRNINSIYSDYRELETLSRDARYDCVAINSGDVKYAKTCLANIRAVIDPLLK